MSFLLPLKTVFKHLLLPPAGLLVLGMVGLVLLARRPRLGRILLTVSIGSLWILATPIVSDSLTRWAERYPALNLADAANAQAIVILGGGGQRPFAPEYSGPAAEPYLLERLAYGAYLAKKTGLPILVTGFHVEARAMHDTLLRNFDVEARWVDSDAYDTFQNAQNSARMLKSDGIQRILLVTHATHMGRSVEEFSAAGLTVTAAPAGVSPTLDLGFLRWLPDPEALLRSHLAVYELIGDPVRRFLASTHLRRH